ncbi:hypothetical protein HLASF_0155 [Halanaeroarchaeum sulfurireducens]|uniref:Uncharacterized protein n=1 Tax=Halanaeroarchaeum sulfurireducens TaxID=1604004 RepID=A0A0F7PBG0_9EURY|nr:hypothetical protein HLASF_0155 [Halanaeroarchaeum sulfurireducens]ALG81070.1 hypothetical protein HLASA_0155 [Halanaeroarchaeum sulfurireducens]
MEKQGGESNQGERSLPSGARKEAIDRGSILAPGPSEERSDEKSRNGEIEPCQSQRPSEVRPIVWLWFDSRPWTFCCEPFTERSLCDRDGT